jgi:rare lipoprotein A
MKAIMAALALAVVVGSSPAMAEPSPGRESHGVASWYGPGYKGRRTASGEVFNPKDLTAAHPSLPFGTLVEVSRPDLGTSVVVRITDRGPSSGHAIDLSQAAAQRLRMIAEGTAPVRMQVVGMAE